MNVIHRLQPYRLVLYITAAVGFFGLNGMFLFYTLFQPDLMVAALENPVSLVFVLEAFLMMGFLAWLIGGLGLKKPGWLAFVVLSIIGSLAFSVPSFLLLHLRKQSEPKPDLQHS